MKNRTSLIVCCIISIVLLQYRVSYSDLTKGKPRLNVTTWDAFGYYMYLPAVYIYHDVKHLNWLDTIDKKYQVTGGNGWQAEKTDNGNYVFKYLGGVAILETPWFFIGHIAAKNTGYPTDGFSPPYEYAVAFGIVIYCILAIFLLRRILLIYFSDIATAITLVLLCLASNFIQYAAIDNAQSHAYIFCLYVLLVYATIQWHKNPKLITAVAIGYIMGLASISRPTEAIIFFIPLLWNTQNKESAKAKWQLVKINKSHVIAAFIASIIGMLPQLIYWKITSGHFFFDVGSKWEFLDPHWRVLFGFEKGWFIYTPVTLFFIIGMFFIRKYPFRKSVLWFCLLNIYIIIAWDDWRYGGSYSTRALVQSYPLFALPFGAFVEHILKKRWKWLFYILGIYLLFVNLFQIYQYNKTILHYDDMNRKYYSRIYLNLHPSPIDMSALDSNDILNSEKGYIATKLVQPDSTIHLAFNDRYTLLTNQPINAKDNDCWLKIETTITAPNNLWQSWLHADLRETDSVKQTRVRLFSPISKNDGTNLYAFYIHIPKHFKNSLLNVYVTRPGKFEGVVQSFTITKFERQ